MKKSLVLVCLLVALTASAAAQTSQPPATCGIGHTDLVTGEFICDDPPAGGGGQTSETYGIGHTDKADSGDGTGASVTLSILEALLALF